MKHEKVRNKELFLIKLDKKFQGLMKTAIYAGNQRI